MTKKPGVAERRVASARKRNSCNKQGREVERVPEKDRNRGSDWGGETSVEGSTVQRGENLAATGHPGRERSLQRKSFRDIRPSMETP